MPANRVNRSAGIFLLVFMEPDVMARGPKQRVAGRAKVSIPNKSYKASGWW